MTSAKIPEQRQSETLLEVVIEAAGLKGATPVTLRKLIALAYAEGVGDGVREARATFREILG